MNLASIPYVHDIDSGPPAGAAHSKPNLKVFLALLSGRQFFVKHP